LLNPDRAEWPTTNNITVTAVDGVATFDNVALNDVGHRLLKAMSPNLRRATARVEVS
jgi:hypothetical protein